MGKVRVMPFHNRSWSWGVIVSVTMALLYSATLSAGESPAGQGGEAGVSAAAGASMPGASTESGLPGVGTAATAAGEAGVRLSLVDAVVLSLRHNLDIRVASYNPGITRTSIDQALGQFDPLVSASLSYTTQRTPVFPSIFNGFRKDTRTQSWNEQASIGVKTTAGGSVAIVNQNARIATGNPFLSSVSPFYESNVSLQFTQPLLRNAGTDVNRTDVIIAQNNTKISVHQFVDLVMQQILSVNGAYWTLVFVREDYKAKEKSLTAAEDLLRNTVVKYEAGAVARVEVTQARAQVAARQSDVVSARAAIKDAEDRLRQLVDSPEYALLSQTPIVPTDTPSVYAAQLDLPSSVHTALVTRPDILLQAARIESFGVAVARAKNQLLPEVDLQATYTLNGLGRGWDSDYDLIGTFDERNISAGVTLSVPLGNRIARSAYAQSRYLKLQALAQYESLERNVTLAVKKAIRDVATSLQQVETNRLSKEAAQEQLDAEVQKFQVGQEISFFVLDAQQKLQAAESAYVASLVNFNIAMANYYRQTGQMLSRFNIEVLPSSEIKKGSEALMQ